MNINRQNLPLILIAALFCGAILWSILTETLLPLVRAGNTAGLIANLAGIPIILVGTGVIVWGGWRVVRDLFSMMASPEVKGNVQVIRQQRKPAGTDQRRAAQWANLRHWAAAMLPGSLRMFLGFVLIAIGGFIINVVGA